MSQAMLSVRMEESLKQEFDAFCAEIGMNASVAVNIFARTVVREKRIPFEITTVTDPFYSDANLARLARSFSQLKAGEGVEHELIEGNGCEQ